MEIKKKSVYRYGEMKQARKISPWYATVIAWVVAPFMFFKLARYRKRHVIFPIVYILAIIAFAAIGILTAMYPADWIGDDPDSVLYEAKDFYREVYSKSCEYMGQELVSYDYMIDIAKKCADLTDRYYGHYNHDDAVEYINDLAQSDKPIYGLEEIGSFTYERNGSSTYYYVYRLSDAPLKINSVSIDASDDELKSILADLDDSLDPWRLVERYINRHKQEGVETVDVAGTLFDPQTLKEVRRYERLCKLSQYLPTVYLPSFGGGCGGIILAALITTFVIDGEKDKKVKKVEKEVAAVRGKAARKEFSDNLWKLSKDRDVDGFNRAVNAAHDDYEARKDKILTRSQMRGITQKTVMASVILDGRNAGKTMQKEMDSLYKNKDFERIAELSQEYQTKLDEYKQRILNEQKSPEYTLEYDGKSTFDGTVLQRIGWTLLCNFVTVITLGIAYPVTLCWKMRWQLNHTVYNGKRLSFDGTVMQLFGKWLLWGLLTIVTLGIYGFWVAKKLEQWKAKHTHIAGERAVLGGTFDGSVFGYLGWNVLAVLLSVLTLGIAVPFVTCWKTKWLYKHRVYDGKRMNFDGNGAQLIGKYLLWLLLTAVTLGIYGLWVQNKMLQWQASHTTLNEETECVI